MFLLNLGCSAGPVRQNICINYGKHYKHVAICIWHDNISQNILKLYYFLTLNRDNRVYLLSVIIENCFYTNWRSSVTTLLFPSRHSTFSSQGRHLHNWSAKHKQWPSRHRRKNSETHGAVMTIAKILSNVIVLAGHFLNKCRSDCQIGNGFFCGW